MDRDDDMGSRGASYEATTAPRRKRDPRHPTHWVAVEVEGEAPSAETHRTCRSCGAAATVLVADPSEASDGRWQRNTCPKCAGEIRRHLSYPGTRSAP